MARILTLTLNPALDLTVSLDMLQPGAVNRTLGTRRDAAGKGLNVAQVLADLGHSVTVGGFLGAANAAPFGYPARPAVISSWPSAAVGLPTSMGPARWLAPNIKRSYWSSSSGSSPATPPWWSPAACH